MGSKTRDLRRMIASATGVLRRFELGDSLFRLLTQFCAHRWCSCCSAASLCRWPIGSAPALKKFGLGFLTSQAWNPVTENFGAAARHLRHAGHVPHRPAHRHAYRLWHRGLPDRTLPARTAPPDRRGGGVAGRHSLDHLRHLGHVHFRAVPAGDRAAGADRRLRRRPLAVGDLSPDRLTASASLPPG